MIINTLYGEDHIESRVCSDCGVEKPLCEFSMDTTYVRSKCKECKRKHTRETNLLRKSYPKPPKDHACPICGDTEEDQIKKGYVRTSWCLDHDHNTGKFRGYLCHLCNTGLSNFKDNPDILEKALEYFLDKSS